VAHPWRCVLIVPAVCSLATCCPGRPGWRWSRPSNKAAGTAKYRPKRAYRAMSNGPMASASDLRGLDGNALASAEPAKLKEFVEHDVLAARGQLEAALAHHPNAVNLWEAYVWTFVVTSDTPLVIEAARRALARQASPNLLLWLGAAHLHRGENPQALSAPQPRA